MNRDYEQIAEKFWSMRQKPGEEANRDRLFRDDQILHAHLEKEIESRLDGVRTVLDAGGGTGRFSVWLAQKGIQVTHLDISLPMLEKARERAEEAGVAGRIEFVHGRLTELAAYREGQFDLVISLDAPISYTYPKHEEVIRELIRVSARSVVFCVSSRLGGYPGHFGTASKKPFLVDEQDPDTAMRWYVREWEQREKWRPDFARADELLETGLFADPDTVYEQMKNGGTPWPVTYSFRPEELKALFDAEGLREVRLAGPGALARTLPGEALRMLMETPEYRAAFLERCYRFDSEPSVCGMGYCSLVASGSKG
ncbi:MAG: Methyltransferase type 11 [Paenibacillaceae bacterium]|jgi:SAM-dependent methyltransferase|nr:Methyltransferase type 11 [Paenibacillaceae bacterium]